MSENYGSLLPERGNTQRILEAKILLTLSGSSGGGGGSESGTGDPNGQTFSDAVVSFNEFDSGGMFVRTWVRQSAATPWV